MEISMHETATTAQETPVTAKIRSLVIFHDNPRKHLPSINVGEKTCIGTEVVDVNKIALEPMAEGISVAANLKKIAGTGKLHMDAHALEAFLDSPQLAPLLIPECFNGKKVFFGGCQDSERQQDSLYVMYMAQDSDGRWTSWFTGVNSPAPENSAAACVEKKEILG